MRMNIYIEGKQSDIPKDLQQRTKRALSVLKDIGFDIKLGFSVPEDESDVTYLPDYNHRPLKVFNQYKELVQ